MHESEASQSCQTQRPQVLQPTRLLHPWEFPGKSTGVGCHCFLLHLELRSIFQDKEKEGLGNPQVTSFNPKLLKWGLLNLTLL